MSERVLNISITGQTSSLTLPSDFLEIISLYMDEYELERVSMRKYREVANRLYTGQAAILHRQAEKLLLHPQPSSGKLTSTTTASSQPLSADSDENVLTQSAPDLVIYGALSFASDLLPRSSARKSSRASSNSSFLELQEQANDQELQGGTQSVLPSYRYQDE